MQITIQDEEKHLILSNEHLNTPFLITILKEDKETGDIEEIGDFSITELYSAIKAFNTLLKKENMI